jgi:acyl dehydratase/GNAT superfamily N-acetyltransferase
MDNLNFSPIESSRFLMNIHRASLSTFKASEIKNHIIENNVDVLILRLPSSSIATHSNLQNTGFDIIHADSLVYYKSNLEATEVNLLKNKLNFVQIDHLNSKKLNEIIPIIFKNYQNHYFSNPFLNKEKIIEGYIEWAKKYSGIEKGKISWLIYSEDEIAGFATCSFNEQAKECEGVLYGVMPNFSGKGIYSDIIRFTQKYFKEQGYTKMLVSTQLQNIAVQKVWSREGFIIDHSYETYHINAFLNYSVHPAKSSSFIITDEIIEDFAKFSGDRNKLHFEKEFAQKFGFKDRIAHGMITQSNLSKIFGIDYPGNGTLYLSNKNIFIAPVYLNKEYYVSITTYFKSESGLHYILAKISDKEGRLCLLSYNYMLKR